MNDDKRESVLPAREMPEWLRLFADHLDDHRDMGRSIVCSEETTSYLRAIADEIEALKKDRQRLDWLGRQVWSIMVAPNSRETPIRDALDKLMRDGA